MILLVATLLLAQHEPPSAAEHRAEAIREEKVAEHEESIADHIFHHVQDEVVVPLGFWAGNRYVRLDITKHVINMWVAAGILLIVVGLGARRRALIPKGGYNLLETLGTSDQVAARTIWSSHAEVV